MKIKFIYIVLPVYNEESSLERLLLDISKVMNSSKRKYKILCVDDGSIDKSKKILNKLKRKLNLIIVSHPYNLGLGYAIKTAFLKILQTKNKESVIVRLDSDNTHNPIYILDLIREIEKGSDVVIASRFLKGGNQYGVPVARKFLTISANKILKFILNIKNIKEITCGYRAYRYSIIDKYVKFWNKDFVQLANFGFSSTVEKLVKLNLIGAKITEIPFILRYDKKTDESKMIFSLTSLGYLVMIILLYFPFNNWREIIKKNVKRN